MLLKDKTHEQPYADARHVAMYLAREMTVLSMSEIGRSIGTRHHTTILYGVRKVRSQIEQNEPLAKLLIELEAEVRSVGQQKLVYQQERRKALAVTPPLISVPGSSSKGAA